MSETVDHKDIEMVEDVEGAPDDSQPNAPRKRKFMDLPASIPLKRAREDIETERPSKFQVISDEDVLDDKYDISQKDLWWIRHWEDAGGVETIVRYIKAQCDYNIRNIIGGKEHKKIHEKRCVAAVHMCQDWTHNNCKHSNPFHRDNTDATKILVHIPIPCKGLLKEDDICIDHGCLIMRLHSFSAVFRNRVQEVSNVIRKPNKDVKSDIPKKLKDARGC